MDKMTRDQLPAMLQAIADTMAEHEEELCAMDAKLGDGDLGLTMKKGFGALPGIAESAPDAGIGKTLMTCGMKMTSVIPSTMGFLMGSGLMSGGKAVGSAEEMTGEVYARFVRGFADGIVKRGKCKPGDRTILDAIDTAAGAAEKVVKENPEASFSDAAAAAAKGAEEGAEATGGMTPKFGKAAVHRDAATGVRDQGAVAGMYLLQAVSRFAGN